MNDNPEENQENPDDQILLADQKAPEKPLRSQKRGNRKFNPSPKTSFQSSQ